MPAHSGVSGLEGSATPCVKIETVSLCAPVTGLSFPSRSLPWCETSVGTANAVDAARSSGTAMRLVAASVEELA